MAAIGKHFPGHGGIAEDSHTDLPVDSRSLDLLWEEDIVPFRRLIDNGIEGVMPAHVIYDQVDRQPAGFSAFWLKEVLRRRLGFQGVIFSDDLSMAAAGVVGGPVERAVAAIEAGCDVALVCNDRDAAGRVLEALVGHRDPVSQSRLVRLHGRHHYDLEHLHEQTRWRNALALISGLTEDPSLSLQLD
jgi:beta-N-acetylhexosaminidase